MGTPEPISLARMAADHADIVVPPEQHVAITGIVAAQPARR